jgi:hypothetical protein
MVDSGQLTGDRGQRRAECGETWGWDLADMGRSVLRPYTCQGDESRLELTADILRCAQDDGGFFLR